MPPYPSPALLLQKRDNMGFQIAPSLIIFLVILGAGALVCCGFAVFRFYSDADDDASRFTRSPEQDAYMREVRERSWAKLPKLGAPKGAYYADQHAHAPMSPR